MKNRYRNNHGKIWCRIKINDDYFIIHKSIAEDKRLSLKAKGLYLLIYSYINKENVQCNKDFLLNECREGKKAFEKAWKELKTAGYLIQKRKQDYETKQFYWDYELVAKIENENKIEIEQIDDKYDINRPGYIYVMKCFNYYKIGKSKDCARLGEYTNLPEEPKYYLLKYVSNMTEVENLLHEKYANVRTRDGNCEWFSLTEKDIQDIKEIIEPYEVKEVEHTKYYYEYVEKNIDLIKD